MEIIATVQYTNPPSDGKARWTRLKPLCLANEGLWIPVRNEEQRSTRFPEEGLVFWWDSPPDAEKKHSLWTVRVEENIDTTGPDKMRVIDFWPFHHFEDLSGLDSQSFRRRCARKELELDRRPLGSVLLRLPNSTSEWVGPVEFEASPERLCFVGPTAVPTGFLNRYDVAEDDLQRLFLGKRREREIQVLKPQRRVEETQSGFWAAQDDEHLLQGVLKRLQQFDHEAATALEITGRTFEDYIAKLGDLQLIGDESRRERARAEAARDLLGEAELNRQFLDEVAEMLLSRTDVSRRVEEAVKAQTDSRVAEVERSLREMEEDRRVRLEELDSEIQGREAELTKAEERLRRREDEARERLEAMVKGIMEEPVEVLAENFLLQAVTSIMRERSGEATRSPVRSLSADGKPLISLASLLGAARTAATRLGLGIDVCLSGIAALLAGRRVLVSGGRKLDLCRLLGSLVSGGSVWEVVFPTNIFGIEDILNLPATQTGGVDAVVPLGDLFLAAANSDHLVTVMFRGLNRAPLETGFDELVYSDRGGSNVRLAWSGRGSRGAVTSVPIPTRVHILGTLSTGSTCFEIPDDLADRLALLESDRGSSEAPVRDLSVPRMHATEPRWSEIVEESREKAQSLGASFTIAEDERLEAEYLIYAGVFDDQAEAAAEWLIARRSRQVARASSSFIERLPEDVRAAVESAREAGALDASLRHLDRE